MKIDFTLAAALLAFATGPALAQDRDWHRDHERRERHEYREAERHEWREHRFEGHYGYRGWRYPAGYGYRRWGVGIVLPGAFYTPSYYYNDYRRFGLAPPPPQLRWVKNGPDLILVNVHDGRVRDVRYNVF